MSNRTVTVSLKADTTNYEHGMGRASRSTTHFGDVVDRTQRASRHGLARLSSAHGLLATAVTGSIGAVVVSSVKQAAAFDVTMRQIAIATELPLNKIGGLRDLAMQMGKDTVFSAQDAGGAMLELAKSGLNEAQIKAGALASTLTLASAGSLELRDAASYVTTGLALFDLKADQSAAVAAALAGGANAARGEVSDLGLALSQVGPGAFNAGLSLQETTGVLALFAKNGILGSDAGTSLKTMLARLEPQTDKQAKAMRKLGLDFTDAKGNFLDIKDVAGQLHDKLMPLSEAQRTTALNTIFGSDAARAASILMREGEQAVVDMTKATSDKTQADKLAAAATSGSAGALSQLSGSIDTAKLQLGEALTPLVIDLANHMTDWTNGLTEDVIPAIADFVQGMQDGTGPGGEFVDVLVSLRDAGGEAWDMVKPLFHFVGDHPKLFAEVAKDAVLLAGALKVMGAVKGLSGTLGGLTGRGGRGPGGAMASATGAVPVFVTNPGFGGPGVPGLPGGSKVPPVLGGPKVPVLRGPALLGPIGVSIDGDAALNDLEHKFMDVAREAAKAGANTKELNRELDKTKGADGKVGGNAQGTLDFFRKYAEVSDVAHDALVKLAHDPAFRDELRKQAQAAQHAQAEVDNLVSGGILPLAAAADRAAGRLDHQRVSADRTTGALSGTTAIASALRDVLSNMPRGGTYRLGVKTSIDPLGRKILETGGQLYVRGSGGTMVTDARASGGPITAGHTYLVGEDGPELLTAPYSGTVIPADATRQLLEAARSGAMHPAAYTYSHPQPSSAATTTGAEGPAVQMPVQIFGSDNIIEAATRKMAREVGLTVAGIG